jgi:hypothetical protein
MDYKNTLKKWIEYAINNREKNIFEYLCVRIEQEYEKPCSSISEIKQRCTKVTGDLFENLCVLYLEYLGYETYLLKDITEELLNKLKLTRKDYGIDIIVHKDQEYSAVQCKYKTRKNKKLVIVSWKDLSTFYALCSKTGPWKQKIVMTTANGKKLLGEREKNDITIGYKTFYNLDLEDWKKIINFKSEAYSLTSGLIETKEVIVKTKEEEPNLTKEYIREQRLKYLKQKGFQV